MSALLCVCSQLAFTFPHFVQVFVFDVGRKAWRSYDWNIVTTVAAFGKYDSELMCYAHSKGARVVLKGRVTISIHVSYLIILFIYLPTDNQYKYNNEIIIIIIIIIYIYTVYIAFRFTNCISLDSILL